MGQIEEIWQRLNKGVHHSFHIRKESKDDIPKTFYLFHFLYANSVEC